MKGFECKRKHKMHDIHNERTEVRVVGSVRNGSTRKGKIRLLAATSVTFGTT